MKRKAQIANNTADKLELALQEENSSVQKVENDIKAKEEEIKLKQEQDNEKRKQIEEQNKVLLLLKRDMSDIDVNIENQHSAHKNAINEKIEKNTAKELLQVEIDNINKKVQAKQEVSILNKVI